MPPVLAAGMRPPISCLVAELAGGWTWVVSSALDAVGVFRPVHLPFPLPVYVEPGGLDRWPPLAGLLLEDKEQHAIRFMPWETAQVAFPPAYEGIYGDTVVTTGEL